MIGPSDPPTLGVLAREIPMSEDADSLEVLAQNEEFDARTLRSHDMAQDAVDADFRATLFRRVAQHLRASRSSSGAPSESAPTLGQQIVQGLAEAVAYERGEKAAFDRIAKTLASPIAPPLERAPRFHAGHAIALHMVIEMAREWEPTGNAEADANVRNALLRAREVQDWLEPLVHGAAALVSPRVETEGDAADGVVVAGAAGPRGLLVTIRFPDKANVTIGQPVTARFAPFVAASPSEGSASA